VQAVGVVSDKTIQAAGCPWCVRCETQRNRRQAAAIAENPMVWSHVRQEAEVWLATH
jgi:hypothetical protein